MRSITILLAFTFLPGLCFADELDAQIDKACLRHAVSLVAKLKNNVVTNMSSQQSEDALKLATESCQAYFKKEFSQNTNTVAAAKEKQNKSGSDDEKDWFTELMTSGEAAKKDGNKRLQRK